MLSIDELKKHFAKEREKILGDYFAFLRFKSISADPACAGEVRGCAEWLAERFRKMGLLVEKWEGGAPVLLATTPFDPKKKTLLIYHHYDVQPVDPLHLWDSPPFEPTLREGTIFARGASDNKGQCTYTLFAIQTLLEKYPDFPVNLKLLIEGEEECGSSSLSTLLQKKKQKLQADHILIVDAHIEKKNRPAISLGARGIVTMTMTLKGSKFDLHSGNCGGIVYNPLRALSEMVAKTHDTTGRVTIPHFYDQVTPLSSEEKKLYNFSFDHEDFIKNFEARATGGEEGYSPLEAAWIRPTLEINGMRGGYSGPGFKTVIPAQAEAKISARLVPDQDPDTIARNIKSYFESEAPPGIHCEIVVHSGKGKGFRTSAQSTLAQSFSRSYSEVFGSPCEQILLGGSIPISAALQEVAGGDILLIGVALPEDQIHSPNEHFSLDRLELGFLTVTRGIELLAEEV